MEASAEVETAEEAFGVRRAALEALRDGTVRDEALLARVRRRVSADPAPSVQRQALEVYVR
jgi:hypothetical protein